jgi:predicted ABC-type ATPase
MSLPDSPRILVFAGPNGSGKSSVTSAWQLSGLYINADEIKLKRNSTDLEAAREAERLREWCLSELCSFTFETVLSTDRNLRNRYIKSLANIPRMSALCDVFRIVDNTGEPETIYLKDSNGTQIRPNNYWTDAAIESLVLLFTASIPRSQNRTLLCDFASAASAKTH